jgi:glycosyltransferase involved in cell wall biosynthesis
MLSEVSDNAVGRATIIIAAYNCEATIASAVESCLAQTYQNTEVIVVNDGSTDGTARVLSNFAGHIRVIDQANGGLANARNTGARQAAGEFVAWMDADDLVEPDRIAIQVAAMRELNVVLVSTNFSAFASDSTVLEPNYVATYYRTVSRRGGIAALYPQSIPNTNMSLTRPYSVRVGECYEALLLGNFVHPPTVMVRRQLFDEVGYFDTSLRYSSDYDFILRVSRLGSFAFIENEMLRYRLSPAQMSHTATAKIPLETLAILEKVRQTDPGVYRKHAAKLDRKVAEQYLYAAESTIAESRTRALSWWLRAQGHKIPARESLRVLAKVVMPRVAIDVIKRGFNAIGLTR